MADEDRTYTEAEHYALLSDAVNREVANARSETEDEIAELRSRVDVLEAERASEVQAREQAQQELEQFRAEVAEREAIAERREARVGQVRAAHPTLQDDYFTDERVQRWAEMADEAFNELVGVFAETALQGLSAEERTEVAALEGEERSQRLAEIYARRSAGAGMGRETAAFTGGESPGDPGRTGSTTRKFFGARGLLPTAAGSDA